MVKNKFIFFILMIVVMQLSGCMLNVENPRGINYETVEIKAGEENINTKDLWKISGGIKIQDGNECSAVGIKDGKSIAIHMYDENAFNALYQTVESNIYFVPAYTLYDSEEYFEILYASELFMDRKEYLSADDDKIIFEKIYNKQVEEGGKAIDYVPEVIEPLLSQDEIQNIKKEVKEKMEQEKTNGTFPIKIYGLSFYNESGEPISDINSLESLNDYINKTEGSVTTYD